MAKKDDLEGPGLLRGFMDRHKIPQEKAAQLLGVSRTTIYNWIDGPWLPTEQLRLDIEIWTNGEVPREAWGPLADRREKPHRVRPFAASNSNGGKGAA